MKCSRLGVTLAVWCVILAAGWTALPVQAQQFVLVDVEYTATSANTMDSHYRVKPKAGIPTDWVSPVSYAKGKVYVELEVLEKPAGTKNTFYNICIENPSNPACLPYMMYTATGKYKANFSFSEFWQNDVVDWTKGCTEVSLILKNENGDKQQGNAEFYPYKAHVVLTVVAPGGTYVPPTQGAAGSPAAGSGGSSGKGGAGGAGGKSGSGASTGGMSASSGGKGGAGGASASAGGKGGSSGMSAGGKGGAGGMSASASVGGKGGSSGKSSDDEPSTSAGSSAANSGSEASAGTLGNQVTDRSVSSQLESSDGCSTTGKSASGASWFLLGLALLIRRRRS